MRLTRLLDDHLLGWLLLAVLAGVAFPPLAAITRFSTPILVVMVGSTSLLLSLDDVRAVNRRALLAVLLAHALVPLLAFSIARILGLPPAVTAGFVLLGAVTPELVSPTMTALADGDVALSSVSLVAIGVASVAYTPASVTALLGDTVRVDDTELRILGTGDAVTVPIDDVRSVIAGDPADEGAEIMEVGA